MANDKVDYTNNGFTVVLENEYTRYYASVHPEMYRDEDGLDFTGTYFVYLLHPTMGSTSFVIEPEELVANKWITRDAPAWVENEIIIKIGAEISRSRYNPTS